VTWRGEKIDSGPPEKKNTPGGGKPQKEGAGLTYLPGT